MGAPRSTVQTGNRVLVVLDGLQVGLIQSFRASDGYGLESASGIGDIHSQEFVPTIANHSLSISKMTLKAEALRSKGLAPENGDAALKGIEFDVHVQSKDDGTVLRKYIGCVYDSGDMDVSAHRIVVTNAQFKARDVQGTGI